MVRMAMIGLAVVLFYSPTIFACPSGQSCPAGKDCVADSSLCVASSSSTSGSSSEPTTTKDQLGLTLDPASYLQFGDSKGPIDMGGWALQMESTYALPDSQIGVEMDMNIQYRVGSQTSLGTSINALFSSDVANSEIPSETGWDWSLGADAKY